MKIIKVLNMNKSDEYEPKKITSVFSNINKLMGCLDRDDVKHFLTLLVLLIGVGVYDVLGIASIMPFVSLLTDPGLIHSNSYLSWIYVNWGFRSEASYLVFIGLSILIILITSLGVKAIGTYLIIKFSLNMEFKLGRRLVAGYLRQPYSWFLNKHSSEISKLVLSEAGNVVAQALVPFINLLSQMVVVSTLFLILLALSPIMAITLGLVFGIAYGTIYRFLSERLSILGRQRAKANEKRFKVISETFAAIKEVLICRLEQISLHRFESPAKEYAAKQLYAQVLVQMPRYVLEAMAFGGAIIFMLMQIYSGQNIVDSIPILALYVIAGYRLLPAVQIIFNSFSQIRFSEEVLNILHKSLKDIELTGRQGVSTSEPLRLSENITFDNVSYIYPDAKKVAIKDLTISIQANQSIAFVGVTGSGKTTTIDILLGLLEPTKGRILIDGVELNKLNRRSWLNQIGYVPQQVFLADETIASNIAFGVDAQKIDYKALIRASKLACLHDFVVTELREGYDTKIGERGVRLSGGQKQRIAIARALYHKPTILVLDESTSALDPVTEGLVMDGINNLFETMTVIIIAHRLSTVRRCGRVVLIENGSIQDFGTYEDLSRKNKRFRAMLSA